MNVTCITPQGHQITRDHRSLLTPDLRELVRVEANQWIKRLRLVRYGDRTMRERFRYGNDSLWWFTELYLHKMKRLDVAVETVLALQAARELGAARLSVESAEATVHEAARAFSQAARIPVDLATPAAPAPNPRWPSRWIGLAPRLSRWRPSRINAPSHAPCVAAFVHTAFWGTPDPQQETYIGPILDALIARSPPGGVYFVGLGPRRNFRARRWWDPATPASGPRAPVTPIERLAPSRALAGSHALWQQREQLARDLTAGEDIRAAALVQGCDLWTILKRELESVALIQWPWSARAMDEAGAALEQLTPQVMLTYAEAGGWGRALVLEARRRGIRSVGIQHGFIYRHWLNYLHAADEMDALGEDAGFPRPDRTLVYDRYAAEHLSVSGHFPADRLEITGSARLESLVRRYSELRKTQHPRQPPGIRPSQPTGLLVAKFSEIHPFLKDLVDAASRVPGFRLIIKPHPAETPDVYRPFINRADDVSIAPAGAELAELLASSDVLVTMNSTVAVDGLVLGLPSLVIGLPNNLSPFVSAGVMVGADGAEKIQRALESVLYDREIRQGLAERAVRFAAEYRLAPEPGAAERAAQEVLTGISS